MLTPNASGKASRAKKLKKKKTSDSKKDTETTQWLEKVLKSFEGSGQGGGGALDSKTLQKLLGDPLVYNVRDHLQAFTGLSSAELDRRLARADKHHFEEVGHAFADPKSATELVWFYSTSSEYLFANAVHPALNFSLTPADGPVLDYSAGVGNTVILLASQGIPCTYFGIGLIESAFAEYRIRRLGLQHLVTFLKPHDMSTNWGFDPLNVLKNDTYGTILALDVLEHIPKWEETVVAMVRSLRPGGRIFEHTPFSRDSPRTPVDLRVHVGRGTLSMSEAMGPQMKFLNLIGTGTNVGTNVWRKAGSV
jgi:2-polyprenyl-3-methyl-5-hydroxy-6-metoxy-1,4-benzoquinol methylase